ncbi:MAG: pyridoxal-phosphate dependent enzyme [Fimbriimonadaceae bacterium]|nr:pyridoxal-phosphate dependent enzyme [Fimbriimonadaceae bacterium]QYK57290.1 MAG: pyridoxal-phosphate dependent enzyme [Fimbriimonadaceae bacterium]
MDGGRIRLCQLPTPVHQLHRLSQELDIDLWIKRDDLTGFAGGGNKGRKLEYLMAQALKQNAEVIVTCGSRQSNFVRQLGGACAVLGLRCVAAVMRLPYEGPLGKPAAPCPAEGGNVVLDDLFGVELYLYDDGPWEDLFGHASDLAARERENGRSVFEVPIGGSSPLGAFAFAEAACEVETDFDAIVVPTSSGSTHAGLAWAFHGTSTKVFGIACDPEQDLLDDVCRLAGGIDELTGTKKGLLLQDLSLNREYVGEGYGVASRAGIEAQRLMARREAILLDPVYSAKAFSGLLGLARSGELGGKTLFWHTGGFPSLFATP